MDSLYKTYCWAHKTAKVLLRRYNTSNDYARAAKCNIRLGASDVECPLLWRRFIFNATIPHNEDNEGSLYAGYIMEAQKWCLPSWIWTSAASVRLFVENDETGLVDNAITHLVECQDNRGVDCPQ